MTAFNVLLLIVLCIWVIVIYKKKSKRPKGPYVPSPSILSQFNTQNLPSKRELYNICKKAEETHEKQLLGTFLGPNNVGTRHIEELHDLGYLPIRIKALPEGTLCPIRVPALTFINTHPDFFWLTNYFETLISATLWLPMTSATTARLYKKELIRHARNLPNHL